MQHEIMFAFFMKEGGFTGVTHCRVAPYFTECTPTKPHSVVRPAARHEQQGTAKATRNPSSYKNLLLVHLVGVHVGDGIQHLLHVGLDVSCRQVHLGAVGESPQVVLKVLERHVHVTLLRVHGAHNIFRDGVRASKKSS